MTVRHWQFTPTIVTELVDLWLSQADFLLAPTARSLILIEPLELMTRESVFQGLPNLRSRSNS